MIGSSDKNRVSLQAFIQEIQNWQLTVSREQKKLKSLRKKIKSKIHLNELDILITEIEGELIRYRKLKDSNKIQYLDIIQQYNENSKRFMDIMENVGNFADKIQNEHILNDNYELEETENENKVNQSRQKYQQQTYTYTISKQEKFYRMDGSSYRLTSKALSKKNSSVKNTEGKNLNNKTMLSTTKSINNAKQKNNSKTPGTNTSIMKMMKSSDEFDSWQIRYQLKQIKSMMSQIQNQIKYHNHEDIELQLAKVQHNNKKMSLQIKGLREDSQYIMTRIQKLKQQLTAQKQIQTQMIQQFENPQRASRKSKSKSIQDSRSGNLSQQQDVSQWVRIRI